MRNKKPIPLLNTTGIVAAIRRGLITQKEGTWGSNNFPLTIFKSLKILTNTQRLCQRSCKVMRNRHRDEVDETLFVL